MQLAREIVRIVEDESIEPIQLEPLGKRRQSTGDVLAQRPLVLEEIDTVAGVTAKGAKVVDDGVGAPERMHPHQQHLKLPFAPIASHQGCRGGGSGTQQCSFIPQVAPAAQHPLEP